MSIITLESTHIIEIHKDILDKSEGLPGICRDKSLDGTLNRIDNHRIYNGLSDLYEIAAMYGIAIAQGHAFVDGNKRTAMISMVVFLELNNIRLEVPQDVITNTMVEVAEKKINLKEFAKWLKSYSKEYSDNNYSNSIENKLKRKINITEE